MTNHIENLDFQKIIEIITKDNFQYKFFDKIKKSFQIADFKIGAHIKYEGAFGITRDLLAAINPKLKQYTPFHHGIYIGNGQVLHFSGGHDNINEKEAEIVITGITDFKNFADKRNSPVYICYHHNASSEEEIMKRVNEILGKKKYNLITNNCEHITNYCITGKNISRQTNKVVKYFLDISMDYLTKFVEKN